MPRIKWNSKEQRNLEWRVALSCLAKAPNGTKIKRARHKLPIHYTDRETQEKVNISHSFIKVNDGIALGAIGGITIAATRPINSWSNWRYSSL